jgi:hypothetical protein
MCPRVGLQRDSNPAHNVPKRKGAKDDRGRFARQHERAGHDSSQRKQKRRAGVPPAAPAPDAEIRIDPCGNKPSHNGHDSRAAGHVNAGGKRYAGQQ